MNKRDFLKSLTLSLAGLSLAGLSYSFRMPRKKWDGIFTMPVSKYGDNEFSPLFDERTVKARKHLHEKYMSGLNDNVRQLGLKGSTTMDLFSHISDYPACLRDNAGGFFNHKLFWKVLAPAGNSKPEKELLSAINSNFGSFGNLKRIFREEVSSFHAEGWIWLVKKRDKLILATSAGNDNPLMDISPCGIKPLLCLDIRDHSGKNQFQSKEEYADNFWDFVNWNVVGRRFKV
jgi:superoxide dismutase, Fe-Mn family